MGWVSGMAPRHFVTLNTDPPLPPGLHLRAMRLLSEMWAEWTHERPTVVVALQRNPQRRGVHSHSLICGTAELYQVRYVRVAQLLEQRAQQWTVGAERVRARCHIRPVRTPDAVAAYVVRYCLREDVEQMVEVFPGDELMRAAPAQPAPPIFVSAGVGR